MSLRFLPVAAVALIATVSSVRADDLAELLPKLPASVFEAWGGEDPRPLLDPANRAKLVAAKGDALTEVATSLGLRDLIIDEKNGFLRFNSNGDGEGDIFNMTFWKCADGSRLVGAAIEHWSNITNGTSHISFWRVRDGKLTDVSKDILPDIPFAKFYGTDKKPDMVKAAAAEGYHWWWKLPQKGTTIRVEAPSMELIDEYADLAQPDHAYEGRWDGKAFTWAKVKPAPPASGN